MRQADPCPARGPFPEVDPVGAADRLPHQPAKGACTGGLEDRRYDRLPGRTVPGVPSRARHPDQHARTHTHPHRTTEDIAGHTPEREIVDA